MLSIDGSHQYDRIRRKHDKAIAIIRFKSLERRYPERPQRIGRLRNLLFGAFLVVVCGMVGQWLWRVM